MDDVKETKNPNKKHQQAALTALLRIPNSRRTNWQRRQIKVLKLRLAEA